MKHIELHGVKIALSTPDEAKFYDLPGFDLRLHIHIRAMTLNELIRASGKNPGKVDTALPQSYVDRQRLDGFGNPVGNEVWSYLEEHGHPAFGTPVSVEHFKTMLADQIVRELLGEEMDDGREPGPGEGNIRQ